MAQRSGGGSVEEKLNLEGAHKIKAIVVEDVKVQTREVLIEVPKYVDKEQTKYITKEEPQVKYKTVEKETVKFIQKEKETVKFIPTEEKTIKYVVEEKEFEVERPVLVEKRYEKPIIDEVVYKVAGVSDVESVKELVALIPKLVAEIGRLQLEFAKVREYKLVEEIIRVPQIKYIPTEVERVVFKDVPKERCKACSKEI